MKGSRHRRKNTKGQAMGVLSTRNVFSILHRVNKRKRVSCETSMAGGRGEDSSETADEGKIHHKTGLELLVSARLWGLILLALAVGKNKPARNVTLD